MGRVHRRTSLELLNETIQEALTPYDRDENLGENPHTVWLPNQTRGRLRDFFFERHDEVMVPVDRSLREIELHWFETVFADAVDVLREMYGVGNVQVVWGLFTVYC